MSALAAGTEEEVWKRHGRGVGIGRYRRGMGEEGELEEDPLWVAQQRLRNMQCLGELVSSGVPLISLQLADNWSADALFGAPQLTVELFRPLAGLVDQYIHNFDNAQCLQMAASPSCHTCCQNCRASQSARAQLRVWPNWLKSGCLVALRPAFS